MMHNHEAMIDAARRQVELTRHSHAASDQSKGTRHGSLDSLPGYAIDRVIHRGGQGVVYRATQKSTGQTVAVKVMRDRPFGSSHDRTRFEREVQILGQFDHPNIVRIIDRGELDGMDFFVMEYIDGVSLDVFQSHDANGQHAPIADTLSLFAGVCDAVHAAHLHGVIHRDLKPGNILVDSAGQPHVLDFGLAKLFKIDGADPTSIAAMTETGQFLGSLPWASPEQVSSDAAGVDIRSDVYSLGVILYQLLTGEFPYRVSGSIREVIDNILSVDPTPPSAYSRLVDDELNTIVLKALNKSPCRRYQSAGDLARDVRHYLAGELIEAKRDSLPYVLRKQLRRHRIAVAVAAGFAVIIATGLIASFTLWRSAVAERDQKQSQRAKAESINAVLHNMLASASPEIAQGREVTVAQVLGAAADDLESGSLRDHPDVEASVRLTLGESYLALGKLDPAEVHLQAALPLCDEGNFDSALCLAALGRLRHMQCDYKSAVEYLQNAVSIATQPDNQSRSQTPEIMMSLATALSALERRDEAHAMQEAALAVVVGHRGENDPQAARIKIAIATHRFGNKQGPELLQEVLEINRATFGPKHPEVAKTLRQLAAQLHVKGQIELAERAYLESLDLSRELFGENHPEILLTVQQLAWLYDHTNQDDKIVPLMQRYLRSAETVFGRQSVSFVAYATILANALSSAGEIEEAEQMCRENLRTLIALKSDQTWRGAECRNMLARLHISRGEYDQAEPQVRESLAIVDDESEKDDLHHAQAQSLLGEILTVRGEFEEAESLLLQGYESLAPRRSMPEFRTAAIDRLVNLYEAWDMAAPNTGKAEQAVHWREQSHSP